MKRASFSFAVLLLLLFMLSSPASAELVERNGHVIGRMEAFAGSGIDVDMPTPQDTPANMPQMKLERIHFERDHIERLLSEYGILPSPGEAWVMEVGSPINPDFELYYREEHGIYGTIAYDEGSPAVPLDESKSALSKASAVVKAFLDELGLDYKCPFFQVVPLEQGLIKVVARLTVNGVPYNTTIGWTEDSDGGGNGDPTPGAFFIVSQDGKLTTAVIRNPVFVSKTQDDPTPLRSWESVLSGDLKGIVQFYCSEDSMLALNDAELVMMTDSDRNAYPAWAYFFTRSMPTGDQFNTEPYSYDILLTYDARTGDSVWRR